MKQYDYYVGLTNELEYFCLQENNSWRKMESGNGFQFLEGDQLFDDSLQLIQMQGRNKNIVVDGENYSINGKKKELGPTNPLEHFHYHTSNLHYHFWLKRYQAPRTPAIAQLRATIGQGDDRRSNYLILNTDSFFEIRSVLEVNQAIKDPKIVAFHSSFAAYNDYVGKSAAADDEYILSTYRLFIETWYDHLQTGSTHYVVGTPPEQSLQETLHKINSWNEAAFVL